MLYSLSLLPFLLVIVASSSSSWPRHTFWRNFNIFKIVYKWPLLMGARTIFKQYLLHKNLTRIHWSKEHRPFVLLEMLKFRQKVYLSRDDLLFNNWFDNFPKFYSTNWRLLLLFFCRVHISRTNYTYKYTATSLHTFITIKINIYFFLPPWR